MCNNQELFLNIGVRSINIKHPKKVQILTCFIIEKFGLESRLFYL